MIKKLMSCLLLICFCFSLYTPLAIINAFAEQPNQFHTEDSSIFNEEDSFGQLNYGFYWVTKGNEYHKANTAQDKNFYDNTKPTVIFIHGYQMNTGHYKRETMSLYEHSYINSGDSFALADYWIERDYNVLMYYWNQLSDEPMPWDAETKIWTADGPLGMRWRKSDGAYTDIDDESNPNKSMAELFIDEYLRIFRNHQGGEIRLVGHSLGGMFSIAAMGLMYDMYQNRRISSDLIPLRLSLIDPYLGLEISPGSEFTIPWKDNNDAFSSIKNKEIKLACKDYIKKLHEFGVAIDYYYATMIGELGLLDMENNDLDWDLSPYVAIVDYNSLIYPRPSGSGLNFFIGLFSTGDLHCEIRDYYFYSINFDPPLDISYPNANNMAISAATPTSYVYANAGNYFKLTSPDRTLSAQDDTYIITSKSAPNTLSQNLGKISGFLFEDANRTGTRNSIKGYEGIEVNLYNVEDQLIATTTTNASGYYSFETPEIGEYYLVFDKGTGTSYSVYRKSEDYKSYDLPSMIDDEGKTEIFSVTSRYSNIVINAGIIPSVINKIIIIVSIISIIIIGVLVFAIFLRPKKT